MKLLVVDEEGQGVDISLRAHDAGHDVRYWCPPKFSFADGMVEKPKDWEPSMDWAELVILVPNCDSKKFTEYEKFIPYFGKGYPIFGTNPKSAELELDRGVGQQVLAEYGIETLPYKVVSSADEGIAYIAKTGSGYAMKPWGGEADKALTCVGKRPEDCIFTLEKWKREGVFNGQLMLQELADGIEIGISCFFGPGGWTSVVEESFEHKKLMNDDLGPNTGEMGTVIRHVTKSKLFEQLLEPLTDYLHSCRYVGDVSVNCIVDRKRGTPWPLEFTMRLGWPDFCIRQEVIQGDPVAWCAELLFGRDTLQVSTAVTVGILVAHGDFPHECDPEGYWSDFPITGISDSNYQHVCFQQVKDGKNIRLKDGKVHRTSGYVTAGNYVLIANGSGRTVAAAADRALEVAKSVHLPSNVMFRTDIGKRLESELPILQQHGYALGMRYL